MIKVTDEQRQTRQDRLDAGDENAALKFSAKNAQMYLQARVQAQQSPQQGRPQANGNTVHDNAFSGSNT